MALHLENYETHTKKAVAHYWSTLLKQSKEQTLQYDVSFPPEAYAYGLRSSGQTHGVVLTKPHVVDLILDLADYREEKLLHQKTLLDPSCGHGAFVVAAAKRLLDSTPSSKWNVRFLGTSLHAYDIDHSHVEKTRINVRKALHESGVSTSTATALANRWVTQADFLLTRDNLRFDAIVGNPPYIRTENISPELQAEYRSRYCSIFDRADLYIPFIEKSLQLLSDRGRLSFICADRWILNRYGAPLRKLITENFGIRTYIDLHEASPFESEVSAYPSIFVLTRRPQAKTIVAKMKQADRSECTKLSACLLSGKKTLPSMEEYPNWFTGDEPWILTSSENLRILRDLEERFDTLEYANCAKVGIGIATGCDKAFIVDPEVDIEPDRLVPLVMRSDLVGGKIQNTKRFVINTFLEPRGLVDLDQYPRLSHYFNTHAELIRKRHVAKRNPGGWFRTIDRLHVGLTCQPKLLIPDIAGSNQIVLDKGLYYPHHNLYYITSQDWDLEALGGILSSKIALFFIWSYAVKMRGGYLRFQAQYLRKIRVPNPQQISKSLLQKLAQAFRKRDFNTIDELALDIYGLQEQPQFDFLDTRT